MHTGTRDVMTPLSHRLRRVAASTREAVYGLIEARRRSIATQQEFYNNLEAWRRQHNLPSIAWEDDWRARS